MGLIPTYPAALVYECAFNASPSQNTIPPYWTDITARTVFPWSTSRGRQYELDTVPAGQWNIALDNRDGALDPGNTASAFYPNVVPYRATRIRAMPGANMLTPDQATCGQGSPYPAGTAGAVLANALGVTNDFGYTLALAASGSAYTGTQVYQVTLPSGATSGTSILLLSPVPVVPGQWYSASAEVVIPSGSTVTCNTVITYFGTSGTQVGSASGTAVSVTSGSATWTTLTASGQAPTNATAAYYATVKVEITASVGSNTTFQVGALQWENSQTPTPWQAPQSLPANLFPQVIATGSQCMNVLADSVANWWWASGPTGQSLAQASYLTPPPSGHTVALAWTTPSGTTNSSVLYCGNYLGQGALTPQPDNVQVTAGATYTASWYASRASSADATIQVTPHIKWFNASGGVAGTTNGTAFTVSIAPSWVQITVTGTAPAGAVWARVSVNITSPAGTTAQNMIYLTGWQFEANASATTWMDPGPTGFIFNGLIERWPQTWTYNGTWGQVGAIGVDAEAVIAQDTLLAPFVEEVLATGGGPNFFYQLADPAGASTVVDTAAKRPPAPIENSPYGPGSITLGSSVTSASTTGGVLGSSGTCATFDNNPTGVSPYQFAETFINIGKTTVAPGPPTAGSWTRILHFRCTTIPATFTDYNFWVAFPATYNSFAGGLFYIAVAATTGYLGVAIGGPGTNNTYNGTTNMCDGNWHQVVVGCDASGGRYNFYVDGVNVKSGTSTGAPTGVAGDLVGCSALIGSNQFSQGVVGDVAHVIEFPFQLTSAQVTNLYQSWRNASAGESSGARAARVLNWIGYKGATAIDAGSTANMGPASDLTGATGLDAINAVELTENGNAYVSASGAFTFTARSRRYNQLVPSYVFGENAANGEWPYESVSFDYDPTHLFNDIQVTQYSTGQVAEAVDAPSEAAYFQRVLQRTTNQALFTETQDAAAYLLQQYRSPRARISDVTLHPSAVPGLFRTCLQLEIGTRIRIMRRPPAPAAAIQVDCYLESINWDLDPGTGDALVHLQCSPADLAAYWTMGALHTTLSAQATSGTNTASINALPDSALNALAQSVPSGYQLTFEPGTARAETMTIAPGGIPATGIGWSSATLTFTSNFAFTHAAGTPVCEPLPTAYTDPTTWDPASVIGAASTTLAALATGGTNTITVNALADAKTNAPGSDWSTGDLLWIAPGALDFEGYNLLTPNQATAGGGVLPLTAGTAASAVGMGAFYGTPAVTASGSAFTGTSVWQSSVAGGASTGHTLINVMKVAVTGGLAYTFSVYVRSLTSGANPTVNAQLGFVGGPTTTATGVTLTGASGATWTRLTVTATAPAGAQWATLGVNLATAPASAWTFQADALQLEQNSSASAYQTCPQVQSVAVAAPGYSTVTITLANNLAGSHPAGEYVCDPLPPGTAPPTAVPGSARLAY